MKTLPELQQEFGARAVNLLGDRPGLRAGLKCEVRSAPGEHTLDFVATDETVDRYNEVIRLDGWQLDNYRANPVVVDSHDYSILKILGNSPEITIADGKMTNRVHFAMDNPLGVIAHGMAKGGFIRSQSVGFIPIAWENGKTGQPDRTYTKQELLEISLVAIPANPGATIGLALKSGAVNRADLKALFDVLKALCNDQEEPLRDARATAQGIDFAQLLPLTRSISAVLKRA
jgi:HK97 family phage prohead protease